ncbi:hypothetical protein [Methanobacterium subterraneum]|uniref:hypothetical protein n=1 Tax=Methanobacterium subterraneum TaxID=59277 RepID=UPI00194FD749|nr:hypothetical protein [Methanobacterium subterraneum]
MKRFSNVQRDIFEYYSPDKYVEIEYHGKMGLLWKTDFKKMYLENFPQLKLIKEVHYRYNKNNELIDQMFLLEK